MDGGSTATGAGGSSNSSGTMSNNNNNNNYYVTDTNKTPLIQIVTWFLLASAILCGLCRAYTKYAVIRIIGQDDYFVLVSLILIIAQSIAVTLETTNGYGKELSALSVGQVSKILQSQYAAALLYIPSVFFSKLPTVILLNLISPVGPLHRVLYGVLVILALWSLSSFLVTAFQCHLPHPWDYLGGRCIDRLAFLTYFETVNAFTDAVLVILPLHLIFYVQTSLTRKFSVTIVFCARLLSPDPLFYSWPITICTQLIQLLSLLAACILHLRPFLESLTSGFVHGDDLRRRGGRLLPSIFESYADMANAGSDGGRVSRGGAGGWLGGGRSPLASAGSRKNRWERSWAWGRGRWGSWSRSRARGVDVPASSNAALSAAEGGHVSRSRDQAAEMRERGSGGPTEVRAASRDSARQAEISSESEILPMQVLQPDNMERKPKTTDVVNS